MIARFVSIWPQTLAVLRFYLILLLLSPQRNAFTQVLRPSIMALNPLEDVYANAALPASVKSFTIGLRTERRYLLKGLDNYSLTAAQPLKNGGLSLSLAYFAAGAFRQSETGLAYAKKLGQVDAGLQFSYHRLSIIGYGKAGALVADAGTLWRMTRQLKLAAGIYNLSGGRLGGMREKLAYETRCALGYQASLHLLLFLEIARQESKPVAVRAGMQYQPAQAVVLYAGMETATAQPYFACSFHRTGYSLLVSVRLHQQLGMTPGLGLLYVNEQR